MTEFQESATPEEMSRYRAYDRITGNISWLPIALVSLDIKLLPCGDGGGILPRPSLRPAPRLQHGSPLPACPPPSGPVKTFIDLMAFPFFIVGVSWFTGRTNWLQGMLELFPFMLIAHLGAMLSGETESARRERQATRYGKPYAICMVDADNLKKINDLHGHSAGTELIRHVARIIGNNLRDADIAARYGGAEFVVMFTETTKQQAVKAVRRIVETLESTPFSHQGVLLSTTLSAGLAGFPEDGADVRTVMANADAALYSSKKKGKNRYTLYLADRDAPALCRA